MSIPLTNTGTISVQSGTFASTTSITNAGTVTISSGATLSTSGAAFQQSSGTTTVSGTLSSNETVSLTGGTLTGTGTVSASVSNAANVSPGNAAGTAAGILTVSGSYVQTSAGTLTAYVAGTTAGTSYSQLSVAGNVALAGTLQVNLNYSPQTGDAYQLVSESSTSSLSGNFTNVPTNGDFVVGIHGFVPAYSAGSGMSLTTSPFEVITWIGPTTGDWNTASDWAGGAVPGSNDEVIIGAGNTVTISSGAQSIDYLTLGGTLDIESGSSLSIATASTVSGTLILDGGTLQNAGSLTVSGLLDWNDGTVTGSGSLTISGTLDVQDGAVSDPVGRVLDQPLSNSGTVNWTTTRATTDTDSGPITNTSTATMNFEGTGGIVASGAAPSFANAGTVNVALTSGSFDFADPLSNTGVLTITSGTLASTAGIANAGTVTIDNGATLSDTGATYQQTAGTTTVDGTLGSDQTVNLANGTLTGTGTVAASLSNSGTVTPGTPLGILTVSGNYTQTVTGNLVILLSGTVAGVSYSQLAVDGSVTLNGELTVNLGYTPAAGDTYELIDQATSAAVNGTFAGLSEGSIVVAGVKAFTLTYLGGPGNDVALTANVNDVVQWIGPQTGGDWDTPADWTGEPFRPQATTL